jgi:deoxyribodipyrimidine photo-lyase
MAESSRVAIVWFRQDLRLLDNPALTAALRGADYIVPLYVLPDGPAGASIGGAARWWLHHSLAALRAALKEKAATLCLRRGNPAEIVAAVAAEAKAATVHVNICSEPHWRDIDDSLGELLRNESRRLERHRAATLFDPDEIRTKTGGIYGMYTPFANAVRAMRPPRQPLKTPERIPTPTQQPRCDTLDSWKLLPTQPDWSAGLRDTWTPGEDHARERGRQFLRGAVRQYDTGRNLPGQDLTSMLSPHLHWGEISAPTLWHALHRKPLTDAENVYAAELIWRDFSNYLLWHKPHLPTAPLRAEFENLRWRNDRKGLHAWQRGQTGIPIVDAGMRQLWHTGWMHNRVRMIVASFLVKHLLIDWRQGADWFMDTLVDADLAANSANWQWVAGTGIDSQPFFRVFNPVSQGEKFDGDGAYVRLYVPELARLPDKYLHAPWTAPDAALREASVTLGKTYPRPLIDLAEGRARALETWKQTVQGKAA